jgi:hypothetical protein
MHNCICQREGNYEDLSQSTCYTHTYLHTSRFLGFALLAERVPIAVSAMLQDSEYSVTT